MIEVPSKYPEAELQQQRTKLVKQPAPPPLKPAPKTTERAGPKSRGASKLIKKTQPYNWRRSGRPRLALYTVFLEPRASTGKRISDQRKIFIPRDRINGRILFPKAAYPRLTAERCGKVSGLASSRMNGPEQTGRTRNQHPPEKGASLGKAASPPHCFVDTSDEIFESRNP